MAKKAMKKYNKFLESMNETDAGLLEKLHPIRNSEDFYLFLNKVVRFLSESLHPHSVSSYFSMIKDYYRQNGFRIYNEDIKQFVDFPKPPKEKKVPVTMEMISTLCNNADPYMMGVIIGLVSSGMRIGEFLQLQKDDIKWDLSPVEVHVRAETTKTGADRTTYLTPQAKKYFPRLKPFNEKSVENFEHSFDNLRKRCGFEQRYRTSNIHTLTPHRFRAFFKTQASDMHDKDYAEDLIGHEGYISTYYALEEDERRRKYVELIPKLTVPNIAVSKTDK